MSFLGTKSVQFFDGYCLFVVAFQCSSSKTFNDVLRDALKPCQTRFSFDLLFTILMSVMRQFSKLYKGNTYS